MKSVKYLVMLVCMTLGLVNVAKAQIYSNEVCYYRNTANNNALIIKFDGVNDRVYYMWIEHYSHVFEYDNRPTDFFENDKEWEKAINHWESSRAWKGIYGNGYRGKRTFWSESFTVYGYVSQLPNSVREVYSGREVYHMLRNNGPSHLYLAFSRDKQTIIQGTGKKANIDYWIRVSKEELLPKNAVPGFLDE